MRTHINVACCVIMTAAAIFDLWAGATEIAGFCALIAIYTGAIAWVSSKLAKLNKT